MNSSGFTWPPPPRLPLPSYRPPHLHLPPHNIQRVCRCLPHKPRHAAKREHDRHRQARLAIHPCSRHIVRAGVMVPLQGGRGSIRGKAGQTTASVKLRWRGAAQSGGGKYRSAPAPPPVHQCPLLPTPPSGTLAPGTCLLEVLVGVELEAGVGQNSVQRGTHPVVQAPHPFSLESAGQHSTDRVLW